MPQEDQTTPVVEPIQKPANVPTGADAAVTSRSGNSTDTNPIKPLSVVDEGPAGGADIPSHQVNAADASRPGTQDALRGQGNSATTATFSREDYAPVSRSQRGNDVEAQKAEAESKMTGPGGDDDFRQTSSRDGDEPQPGRVQPNLNSDKNLVEAGTNMAGAGGADSGLRELVALPASEAPNTLQIPPPRDRGAMSPSSRSKSRGSSKKSGERSRTMHSLGLNRTTLKHVLTPSGHSESDNEQLLSSEDDNANKREKPIVASSKKGSQPLTDVEAQAARIRSARHSQAGPRMSMRRKLYIAGTALVCLLIIVIGIVVGVRIVNEREEAKEAKEEGGVANLALEQAGATDAVLLSEGMSVQARLQEQETAMATAPSDNTGGTTLSAVHF